MQNFNFYNPVKIVFGKGTISELKNLIPQAAKVLMVYGGGSIKNNGVYEQVKAALASHSVVEFSGIEPNPQYTTCLKAVELAQKEQASFILAVGGGSVIDAGKFIAAAFYFDGGNPWEILAKGAPVKKSLPLGTVLTLPATGSEMNRNSVISRDETKEKLAFYTEKSFPLFSILDPTTTFSLPRRQTINGIVDTFVHVTEQYISYDVNTPLQDRQAEAILQTLVEEGPKALNEPDNYDVRANLMWCSTCALNHSLSCGTVGDWATHAIGHELTAKFGIDHAQSLAIVMPALWRHQKERKAQKLAQFGRRVFGILASDDFMAAGEAIEKTIEFFDFIGMPTRLSAYGIKAEECKDIPAIFTKRGRILGEHGDLREKEIAEILNGCS